jgi:hypothetical protein
MAGVWEKEGTSGEVEMWVTAKVVARSVMGVVVEEGGFRACGDGGWGGGGSGV